MKKTAPDYPKIILVAIPVAFIVWFVLLFPSMSLAGYLDIQDYWPDISILLTALVMAGYFALCIRFSDKLGAAVVTSVDPSAIDQGKVFCEFCQAPIAPGVQPKIWYAPFKVKSLICCETCWRKKTLRAHKWSAVLNILPLLFGIFFIVIKPEDRIGWLLVNLCVMYVFQLLMVFVHELGHALAARRASFHVYGIVIGTGRKLIERNALGFAWMVNMVPFGGVTLFKATRLAHLRRKLIFIIAAGPLANLAIALAAFLASPGFEAFTALFQHTLAPLSALMYANILALLFGLWPHRAETVVGKMPSDGMRLLKLLFCSRQELEEMYIESGLPTCSP